MPIFRCRGCQSEFEAAKPTCAACGFDPAADPRATGMFDQLELIHFDPPTNMPGCGKGHAACDAKLKYTGKRRFTSEPVAVTCAACKASDAFAAAGGENNGIRDSLRVGPLGEG